MSRKSEVITLSIQPGTREKLEQIADRLNLYWGDRPSLSGLLNAIAKGEVETERPFRLINHQVKALEAVVKLLVDSGQIEFANSIVELLLEKGELEAPLQHQLINQIAHESEGWRKAIDDRLSQQKPFLLVYENSQKEQDFFNVCYGEITFHEKRFYLDAWCYEVNDNADISELKHNRCLRLDRIKNILHSQYKWRTEGLDYLEVYLHFYKGLIKAYEKKLEDIDVKDEGDKLVVIRKVSNPFWLIREILPYGQNCEIVSPPIVREKFIEEINKIKQLYS